MDRVRPSPGRPLWWLSLYLERWGGQPTQQLTMWGTHPTFPAVYIEFYTCSWL